jgi:hypothetical protein
MSGQRAPKPSPLAGEGAERRRREAGEGVLWLGIELEELGAVTPHPARATRGHPSRKGRGGRAR